MSVFNAVPPEGLEGHGYSVLVFDLVAYLQKHLSDFFDDIMDCK